MPYEGARLLVRMQGSPGRICKCACWSRNADSVADEIWRQLAPTINDRRNRHGLADLDVLPLAGIPVQAELTADISESTHWSASYCRTRDRPESLVVTLRGLAGLRYGPVEFVVVDNAPSSDQTRVAFDAEFGGDPRFRYVCEPRRGSSSAKNRGVREATAEVIAFTDDDTIVDPWWLHGIVRGFGQADDVACVTGLVRTAVLENTAQLYFDQRQAWGASCERRVFDLADHRDDSPLYPYSGGIFGAGANFAMTRSALAALGGFDEVLGAGTLCGGGEDLDVFMRTVLAGHRLVYEPSAVLSHVHRARAHRVVAADAIVRLGRDGRVDCAGPPEPKGKV